MSDDDLDREIQSFQKKVLNFSIDEIERELSELSKEVSFLESQVEVDLDSYSEIELEIARRKINQFKRKIGVLTAELLRRNGV